ncbi:hypothetical protein ACOMHN_005969 [Nucella lapillus]
MPVVLVISVLSAGLFLAGLTTPYWFYLYPEKSNSSIHYGVFFICYEQPHGCKSWKIHAERILTRRQLQLDYLAPAGTGTSEVGMCMNVIAAVESVFILLWFMFKSPTYYWAISATMCIMSSVLYGLVSTALFFGVRMHLEKTKIVVGWSTIMAIVSVVLQVCSALALWLSLLCGVVNRTSSTDTSCTIYIPEANAKQVGPLTSWDGLTTTDKMRVKLSTVSRTKKTSQGLLRLIRMHSKSQVSPVKEPFAPKMPSLVTFTRHSDPNQTSSSPRPSLREYSLKESPVAHSWSSDESSKEYSEILDMLTEDMSEPHFEHSPLTWKNSASMGHQSAPGGQSTMSVSQQNSLPGKATKYARTGQPGQIQLASLAILRVDMGFMTASLAILSVDMGFRTASLAIMRVDMGFMTATSVTYRSAQVQPTVEPHTLIACIFSYVHRKRPGRGKMPWRDPPPPFLLHPPPSPPSFFLLLLLPPPSPHLLHHPPPTPTSSTFPPLHLYLSSIIILSSSSYLLFLLLLQITPPSPSSTSTSPPSSPSLPPPSTPSSSTFPLLHLYLSSIIPLSSPSFYSILLHLPPPPPLPLLHHPPLFLLLLLHPPPPSPSSNSTSPPSSPSLPPPSTPSSSTFPLLHLYLSSIIPLSSSSFYSILLHLPPPPPLPLLHHPPLFLLLLLHPPPPSPSPTSPPSSPSLPPPPAPTSSTFPILHLYLSSIIPLSSSSFYSILLHLPPPPPLPLLHHPPLFLLLPPLSSPAPNYSTFLFLNKSWT